MTTLTRERLEQLANFRGAPVTRQEEQELARIALAAMSQEADGPLINEGTIPVTQFKPVADLYEMKFDDDRTCAFHTDGAKAVQWLLTCDGNKVQEYVTLERYQSAMLQGKAEPVSNSDELPLDYLQGHKDGLEWAAQLAEANHPQTGDWLYDDPHELAKAIRKGPDMPLANGNSPVIPDGWISCSERMPEEDGNYWGWWSECKRQGPVWFIKSDLQAQFQSSEITHWMPLPAAPQ